MDLRHKDEDRDVERVTKANLNKKDASKPPQPIDVGIDLSEFYMSVEWDILQVSKYVCGSAELKAFTFRYLL